jgi:hypothetical protein
MIFFFVWLFSFVIFHVATGAIHILLGLAIVFVIVHLVRGGSRRTPVT